MTKEELFDFLSRELLEFRQEDIEIFLSSIIMENR